jgi:hypothetical protein
MAILTSKLCKPVISYLYREMYNDTAHTRGADRLWHAGAHAVLPRPPPPVTSPVATSRNDYAHERNKLLQLRGAPETASSCHVAFSSRQVSAAAAAAAAASAATASIPEENITLAQGMQRIVELEEELAQSRQEEKRMKKEVEELERRIKALCASHTA